MIMDEVQEVCDPDWIVHGPCNCDDCTEIIPDINNNATFTLEDAPSPHLLVDQDKIGCLTVRGSSRTRCDFIFFADNAPEELDWVAPIEMSTERGKKPNQIQKQLQAGADLVAQNIPASEYSFLIPMYIGHNRNPKTLSKKRIKFHGKKICDREYCSQ